jgi:hypothetical protein
VRTTMRGAWMLGWAAAGLAACAGSRTPDPTVEPVPATIGPSLPVPSSAVPEASAPDARLAARGWEPLDGRGYAALGLTGANKPNGLPYRLRQDVPAATPAYVPRTQEGLELYVAERSADGWMAFYRGPLAGNPDGMNVAYRAVLFAPDGARRWDLPLNLFLSRQDRVEIQDVRYVDGMLYLNEACASYSREAEGRCSALVRVDPVRGVEEWRTGPLVSNNVFVIVGPYVVAGYGFTNEDDALFLIDRATGRVLDRQPLDSAHGYIEQVGGEIRVVTNARYYRFAIEPK